MGSRIGVALTAAALVAGGAAQAATVPFTRLGPDDFQAFVVNWSPAGAPLCAVIGSAAQWNAVMHPAPVMGAGKPYAPPVALWADHEVLLVANVITGSGTPEAYRHPSVSRSGSTETVSYALITRYPEVGTSTIKRYLALETPKSKAAKVVFRANKQVVCTLKPGAGDWVSPPVGPG